MNKDTDKLEVLKWNYALFDIPLKKEIEYPDYNSLKKRLSAYLNQLIHEDFQKLISILYRIDVSEEKLHSALNTNPEARTAGEIITDLIIERQLEKIETKRKYKNL